MKRRPTSNGNFRRSAKRVAGPNRWVPMRGGIRF